MLLIFNLIFGQEKNDPTETLISEFKSELESQNISDFFVLKQITYGTAYIFDLDDPNSCNTNGIYFTMYAFWKKENESYIKKFDNCGKFNALKLSDSKPLDYYQKNLKNLKSEKVKSYQTSPDSIANGLVYKNVSNVTHQPQRYFWFYHQSGVFKNHFDKYDLITEEGNPNLNYKSNNKLLIAKLNTICEAIIDKMNNNNLFKRQKENLNAELNAQIQFSSYPTSNKVEFNIKAEKEYYADKPIEIKLIWKNKSKITEKIMIRDYWGHPFGTGASIMDLNNVELTSQISNHILSSQLFTPQELKEYEIDLQPNEIKEYSVDLLKIPILKKPVSTTEKKLPKGKYKIQVFYYSKMSDKIEIEIK